MTYFEQKPTKQLSKYIDKFWYCQADNLTNSTLTIPLLHHELVFNFSDNYCISRKEGLNNILENAKSWISGIQVRPIISTSEGKHEMMGVLFKPNGLKVFTKYHSSDFENNFIDASLIFDKSFKALLEQIQNCKIAKSKISLIENYLIQNLTSDSSPQYLNTSLNLFELATDKRISVKDTCNQVLISNKSLIKSYQKYIGITPIKYLQLQSINKALLHLSKSPKQSLTKLAYDLNFYDQAHFINLFKTTTNITPTQYSDYVLKNRVDESSPNFISLQG
jgi:methylphosphotriester-DNA--protein-cysteine methyltransferase